MASGCKFCGAPLSSGNPVCERCGTENRIPNERIQDEPVVDELVQDEPVQDDPILVATPPPAEEGAGFCVECGQALRATSAFCANCGTAVSRGGPAAAEPPLTVAPVSAAPAPAVRPTPPPDTPRGVAITAKRRATLSLLSSTALSPAEALALVRQAGQLVHGGGASVITTGLDSVGARVEVEREGPDRLTLSVCRGKRKVRMCLFDAVARPADGRTELRVGGLSSYRTKQSVVVGFIPVGPKMIVGMAPYKRFLDEVSAALTRADPTSWVRIAET